MHREFIVKTLRHHFFNASHRFFKKGTNCDATKMKLQKKKSLPLISRNLSIDVQRFKKKKKISQISRPHVFGIRGKQIAKSPGRDRVPQPRPPGLIVSNLVYPAWRGAQWSLTEKVSSKGTFNSTCDKYRKNKRGRGRGGAKGSRLLRVRGPLSTQSDDYTRGSRVTRHLVLPLSTCNVVAHTHTRRMEGTEKFC